MNIYKFGKKDIVKANDDFIKTEFGGRVRLFSMMPIIFAGVGFVVSFAFILIDSLSDPVKTGDTISNIEMLVFLISTINFSIGCVAQLIYGKLLNDFVKANAKK